MSEQFSHISVLLNESINELVLKPDGIYFDGTFGRGGHSREILKRLGKHGRLIAIDRDPSAKAQAKKIEDPRFTFIHGPFSAIEQYATARGLVEKIDGILFDLGVSSPQLDDPSRGFSFMRDGPLDMRMDPSLGVSAAQWLAVAKLDDIAWVLKTFGEERFAKKIAKSIVEHRENVELPPLTRTTQLATLIVDALPIKDRHKHPATRSFQAIRIFINSELEEIEKALHGAVNILAPFGRLSVISFHSLEDRLVKRFIRDQSQEPKIPRGLPLTQEQIKSLGKAKMKPIGKALKPSNDEMNENARSRSSVLRVAEKLGE